MAGLPKIKSLKKPFWGEMSEEKRVPLPSKTKQAVYERANRRCESCGKPLAMTGKGAQFHHTRKPNVKSTPSTIQFLCATCHTQYGHEYHTVTKQTILGTIKERRIRRKRVHRHKSPYWEVKPKSTTKKAKRKTTPKKMRSKTKKTRKRKPKTPLERLTKQLGKDFLGS